MLNHAGDEELKHLLSEAIEMGEQQSKQVEELLKENGVALAPSLPDPPKAYLDDIPVGARIPDPAIAATLSADIATGLVLCSQIIGKSIREDVAMMFGQFHAQKMALGGRVLRMNKERGWLIPPPLHPKKQQDC